MPSNVNPSTLPIRQVIARAAQRTGANFDYLYREAQLESALDPTAKASTSSAAGLFQFTRGTWREVVERHGAEHGIEASSVGELDALRFDPQSSALMAGEAAVEHSAQLAATLGREPEPVDLYLAHFLGIGGAQRFLTLLAQTPDASAAALFPSAAEANRSIFYGDEGKARSLADVRALFGAKLAGVAPPPPFPTPRASTSVVTAQSREERPPLQLAAFEPMPGKLSLEFAARSYRRLAETRA